MKKYFLLLFASICLQNCFEYEETINFNRDAGTIFYTQTVNVMLNKLSSAKRLELQTVAQGRPMVFVNDSNDNWWAVGYEFGLYASSVDGASGASRTDKNRYQLTLVGDENSLALTMDAAAFAKVGA